MFEGIKNKCVGKEKAKKKKKKKKGKPKEKEVWGLVCFWLLNNILYTRRLEN